MTAKTVELVGIPEPLETKARLIAAARGEDPNAYVIEALRSYIAGGHRAS
jgi:hypothetical protein